MNKKAIVLLSGGLDSILAAKLMMELGVEIVCVSYFIEFAMCGGGPTAAVKAAEQIGAQLKVFDITAEYLEMFKNPKHGYGANINPCIDCKIFMLKKAKAYMQQVGAAFLVTGEVVGERPMSQRKDALNIIERDAGVRGILLRPLSAKLLPPTLAEKEGLVNREDLLAISGRSRKPQFALAEKLGITEYPNPSGGCLLTDPGFAKRVRDLIAHEGLTVDNLKLLKTGRHFRIGEATKLILGRDDKENTALESLIKKDDICFVMKDHEGPFAVLKGPSNEEMVLKAAGMVARHTKHRNEKALNVLSWRHGSADQRTLSVTAATDDDINKIRI